MATNRISTQGVEVFHEGASKARISTQGVEVFHEGSAMARVSTFGVEVFRSISDYTPPSGGRRREQLVVT